MPSCGAKLVAHKGKKLIHHFKHYQTEECKGGVETAIHIRGKEIIIEKRILMLPQLDTEIKIDKYYKSACVVPQKLIQLDKKIILEKKQGNITPDLIVSYRGVKLLVEVAVTHFVDSKKKEKIYKSGLSCLEIDLSKLYKEKGIISDQKIIDSVIYSTTNKRWIYNKRLEEVKSNAKIELEKYIQKEMEIEKNERQRYELMLKKALRDSLENNPSLSFNLEESYYYASKINYTLFHVYGELNAATTIQGVKIRHQMINFEADVNVCKDDNRVESLNISLGEVTIEMIFFKNFIERELQILSNKNLHGFLSEKCRYIC